MNRVAITGAETKEMFANGYRSLCRAEKQVNDLNVFPIPDGDTGTNMLKTLGGGIFSFEFDGTSANEFMKLFARSVLLCARGNSGVILSQFIRGFADGCKEDVLDVPTFSRALLSGAEKAYDAVINPVEGTMLTVIREGAEAFAKNSEKTTLFGALSFVIDAMQE
ncbi:MAG: DAK2 domain-containing protein, partial [Clostridia bacterium]|nr:DAK2 domain-containing protein [Clostridia bacterium]